MGGGEKIIMINLYFLSFAILLLISNYLSFGYGVRIGKAMQKDIPPVPLAEPAKEVARVIRKAGKRVFKLVPNINELKALKKVEKEEINIFD